LAQSLDSSHDPEGACKIIFKQQLIRQSDDPQKKKVELAEENRLNPYIAASKDYIDNVIAPEETRIRLISTLRTIIRKRENRPRIKHGNIPV
jgi:propionyl-CoA carboxylase beta chain